MFDCFIILNVSGNQKRKNQSKSDFPGTKTSTAEMPSDAYLENRFFITEKKAIRDPCPSLTLWSTESCGCALWITFLGTPQGCPGGRL
jgi:hypothetical protein